MKKMSSGGYYQKEVDVKSGSCSLPISGGDRADFEWTCRLVDDVEWDYYAERGFYDDPDTGYEAPRAWVVGTYLFWEVSGTYELNGERFSVSSPEGWSLDVQGTDKIDGLGGKWESKDDAKMEFMDAERVFERWLDDMCMYVHDDGGWPLDGWNVVRAGAARRRQSFREDVFGTAGAIVDELSSLSFGIDALCDQVDADGGVIDVFGFASQLESIADELNAMAEGMRRNASARGRKASFLDDIVYDLSQAANRLDDVLMDIDGYDESEFDGRFVRNELSDIANILSNVAQEVDMRMGKYGYLRRGRDTSREIQVVARGKRAELSVDDFYGVSDILIDIQGGVDTFVQDWRNGLLTEGELSNMLIEYAHEMENLAQELDMKVARNCGVFPKSAA